MKRKTWITLAIVGASIGVGTLAVAAYERLPGRMARGMAFERLAVRLKLTPEQESQIKGELKQARSNAKPQVDAMRNLRATLARQIFTDQPNQAEIQRNADQLKQQLSAMIDQYVRAGLQINSTLKPEQRAEVQKIVSERQQLAERRRAKAAKHTPAGEQAQPAK